MDCLLEKFEKDSVNSIGSPKEIIVDSYQWSANGETGMTYTYHMSSQRFERANKTSYRIYMEDTQGGLDRRYLITTLSYYDFVDFEIQDCIGERKIEELALQIGMAKDELWEKVICKAKKLQEEIREEFSQTEEYKVSMKNREIIEQYKKDKLKFCREYGLDGTKYDRCYNVFGQLMNSDYLNKLKEMIHEREKFSEHSRKKHKQAWRNFSGQSDFFRGSTTSYKEEDKEMLAKFYKVLAKKYHPDSNPGIDTTKEMLFLNQLKKDWGI